MAWPIGIDIAGTFTDVALVEDTSGSVGVAKVPIARFPIEIHAWPAGQVTEAFLGSAPTYLAHATAGARSWRLPTLWKIIIPGPPTARLFEHPMGLQNCRDLRRS
jgi:hypothetical protein